MIHLNDSARLAERRPRAGLLLSFGGFDPNQIRAGMQRLAEALKAVRAGRYASKM